MSTDLLRVEPNQRLDYTDFEYLLNESMTGAMRDMGDNFLLDPNDPVAERVSIIDGFEMTNPSGKQLTVTRGRALLPERVAGVVQYGALTASGDASQTIDMAPLASGTYGIYIRFEYVDAETGSRVFWNPSGDGAEFTQSIPTRREARWSMRVELAPPGAEWLQIGTANNAGGSLVIVDQRNLYFEGPVNDSYKSYWSFDGGGDVNDRNADRQQYGVKDLHTFTQAMRQCLEDIKGRGLRRWWDRDIGGMNIGFVGLPSEDTLAVGDDDFNLYNDGSQPTIQFDPGDYLWYDRTTNVFKFETASSVEVEISSDGMNVNNGLVVGDLSTTPVNDRIIAAGDIYSGGGFRANSTSDPGAGDGIFTGGVVVGFDAVPTDDRVAIGDAAFYLDFNGTDPAIYFDTASGDDYLVYDRSEDIYAFVINNTTAWNLDESGVRIRYGLYVGDNATAPFDDDIRLDGGIVAGGATNPTAGDGIFTKGLVVGFDAAPTADTIAVGDAAFYMQLSGSSCYLYFDTDTTNDYLLFARGTDVFGVYIGGGMRLKVASDGDVNVGGGLYVGNVSTTPANDEIRAAGAIHSGTGYYYFGVASNDYFVYNDTGKTLKLYMDATEEYSFEATQADFKSNNIVTTGTVDCAGLDAGSSLISGGSIEGTSVSAGSGPIDCGSLDVSAGGITNAGAISGATSITCTSLSAGAGAIDCGSLDVSSGGITNAGPIGCTTISATGITGTSLNLGSGGAILVGSLSGVTTIGASGNITTTGNIGRDGNDYLTWTDNSEMGVWVAGTEEFTVKTTGVNIRDGLYIGDVTTAPTSGEIRLGSAYNLWDYNAGESIFQLGGASAAGARFTYGSSGPSLKFGFGTTNIWEYTSTYIGPQSADTVDCGRAGTRWEEVHGRLYGIEGADDDLLTESYVYTMCRTEQALAAGQIVQIHPTPVSGKMTVRLETGNPQGMIGVAAEASSAYTPVKVAVQGRIQVRIGTNSVAAGSFVVGSGTAGTADAKSYTTAVWYEVFGYWLETKTGTVSTSTAWAWIGMI